MKCKNKVGLGTRCGKYDKTVGKVLYCSICYNERYLDANPEVKKFREMKSNE